MEKKSSSHKNLYPTISIDLPKNPKKIYAFPILGLVIKSIFVIPVGIVLIFYYVVDVFVLIINAFIVLFTGKYWQYCYNLNLGIMRLSAKSTFFVYGLTDKYPGFSTSINDKFSIEIPNPEAPKRLYAVPFVGILIRAILIIPFAIYTTVIKQAGQIAIFIATFFVFFKGHYPESFYEISRDGVRLELASISYFVGFSDTYPSFWISMNHKRTKMVLIALGIILFLLNNIGKQTQRTTNQYRYNPTQQTTTQQK